MNCFNCKRTAVGTCRFCGRAMCENHVNTKPCILELFQPGGHTKALVVDDALHCGACHPRPHPLDLPELDE